MAENDLRGISFDSPEIIIILVVLGSLLALFSIAHATYLCIKSRRLLGKWGMLWFVSMVLFAACAVESHNVVYAIIVGVQIVAAGVMVLFSIARSNDNNVNVNRALTTALAVRDLFRANGHDCILKDYDCYKMNPGLENRAGRNMHPKGNTLYCYVTGITAAGYATFRMELLRLKSSEAQNEYAMRILAGHSNIFKTRDAYAELYELTGIDAYVLLTDCLHEVPGKSGSGEYVLILPLREGMCLYYELRQAVIKKYNKSALTKG